MSQGPSNSSTIDSPQATRAQRWLKLVLQLTMVGGLVWSLLERNWLQAAVVGLIIVATLSPIWLSRRYRVVLPPEFELIAIGFLYASLFLGEFGDFYERYWWWDTVLHTASGSLLGIAAFVFMFILNRSPNVHLQLSPLFVVLFAFSFAVAAGAVWEIFEFSMDELAGANMQKNDPAVPRSGLRDTMFDLIVDSLGALVVCAMGYAYLKYGRESFLADWVMRFFKSNPRLVRDE